MQWVRIHPLIQNWPGGGPPPTFDISADENGSVVVEIAWDPQALGAPSTSYAPLRYYNSAAAYNVTYTADDGTSRSLSTPPPNIQLSGNHATWTIPQGLWDAYVQESLKSLSSPPKTAFARNLYYRVRATAPGASQATIWPPDSALAGASASAAPHIGILPISASPSSQVAPDQAAVAAMGGVLLFPNLWSDLLLGLWRHLPESDENRQILVRIFAHQAFQGADLPTRTAVLKLWLFAGPKGRKELPKLLDRNAVVGSNVTMPVISKTDLRGGKTLVDNLLALLFITPHPDLVSVTVKEHLLDDVITEILDPNGQVNQGAAGTCSPTAIQTLLLTVNPAEYVRLQLGMLSASGQTTLASGAAVTIPPAIFQIARYATGVGGWAFLMRTYSELAFQATVLKFAQGTRFPALTGTAQNINTIFQTTIAGGLYAPETKRALDALFSVNFTANDLPFPYQASNAAFLATQRGIRDGLVQNLSSRQQQMIFSVFWGAPYGAPPNGGAHAIMAVRGDGGRIFYKNPQYPGSHPLPGSAQGGTANNPPRRYEDPSQSLESITEADLATWIQSYFVPDQVIL